MSYILIAIIMNKVLLWEDPTWIDPTWIDGKCKKATDNVKNRTINLMED